MNITEQDTFDMLKYGYIKPLTLMKDLENIVPGITRNFKNYYYSKIKQALYDKNPNHKDVQNPDGKIYTKTIMTKLKSSKSYSVGYEFNLTILDINNNTDTGIYMTCGPINTTFDLHKINKKITIANKNMFYDTICNWQNFIDNHIEKIILNIEEYKKHPFFDRTLVKVYGIPHGDACIDETRIKNTDYYDVDMNRFILQLQKQVEILKSFGE